MHALTTGTLLFFAQLLALSRGDEFEIKSEGGMRRRKTQEELGRRQQHQARGMFEEEWRMLEQADQLASEMELWDRLLDDASMSLNTNCPLSDDDKNTFLDMGVNEMFELLTEGDGIGLCFVQVSPTTGVCDLYAKIRLPSPAVGIIDQPYDKTGDGTGCVKAPDFPKEITTCFYRQDRDELYDEFTDEEIDSFCTEKGKKNAVNQIKHALRNDLCCATSDSALREPIVLT